MLRRPGDEQGSRIRSVSILTRPGGRVLRVRAEVPAGAAQTFQSSPGPGAGCCRADRRPHRSRSPVSILTRPGGRVLPLNLRPLPNPTQSFNPHPARGPGAAGRRGGDPSWATTGFNPHPARGPGAAVGALKVMHMLLFRFQSSPGPGAGCCHGIHGDGCGQVGVSILTRPGGRVLPTLTGPPSRAPTGFNPHPARGPGAAETPSRNVARSNRFNPHPARGPGAATTPQGCSCRADRGFNPHPARGPGCCIDPRLLGGTMTKRFNPHPARGPGAASGPPCHDSRCSPPFQSSPGPGAGCCSARPTGASSSPTSFNPHPARGPGAAARAAGASRDPSRVSILTRPGGRVLPTSMRRPTTCTWRFNPHPARGPGAAVGGSAQGQGLTVFQSSPGPGGRVLRIER